MGGAQASNLLRPASGELDADHAVVLRIAPASDQARGLGSVDEANRAVVPQQQIPGDLTDRRTAVVGMPPDRKEELVLSG